MIDAGLGADHEHAELLAGQPGDRERAARGGGGERDGVLARLGHRHLVDAQADRVLGRIDAACAGELGERDVVMRQRDRERVDSNPILHDEQGS